MSVRISAEYASVRVPATSANLGPGFDSLGLAVRFYDEVDVRPVTYATHVDVEGVGAGKVPTDDNNLVVRALRFGLERLGPRKPTLICVVATGCPTAQVWVLQPVRRWPG